MKPWLSHLCYAPRGKKKYSQNKELSICVTADLKDPDGDKRWVGVSNNTHVSIMMQFHPSPQGAGTQNPSFLKIEVTLIIL